jgi:heme/copper-type cytochrome/quinol oxidase subunit 2
MGIGTSLLLIAVGAILRWAVADAISGVNLATVGLILLIVGIVGLVISLFLTTLWTDRNRETTVTRDRYPDARY